MDVIGVRTCKDVIEEAMKAACVAGHLNDDNMNKWIP